jgi:two-component system chemotaxis response regulator CheY
VTTFRVLVIEDATSDQLVISKQLERYNCDVTAVSSAEAALDLWKNGERFELLLVDWNLPGVDGVTFVSSIRAPSDDSHPTIVMITGETSMSKIETAIAAGVDEYIMKPIDPESFREKLMIVGVEANNE